MKELTSKDIEDICYLHVQANFSINQICIKYKIGEKRVENILLNNNITINKLNKRWSQEEIIWLKENFPIKSGVECAKYLGRPIKATYAKAESLSIKKPEKNSLRTDFLTDLNNPINIYFLGLFTADACLSINKKGIYSFSYESLAEDFNIFEKYFKEFGITSISSRHRKPSKPTTRFRLGNKELCLKLQQYGFREKSGKFPSIIQNISKDLIHLFWLGFFDGDGCPSKNQISFSGPIQQDWSELIDYLNSLDITDFLLSRNPHKITTGSSSILISGAHRLRRLVNDMYQDIIQNPEINLPFLKRKYIKCLRFLETAQKQESKDGYKYIYFVKAENKWRVSIDNKELRVKKYCHSEEEAIEELKKYTMPILKSSFATPEFYSPTVE